MLEINQTINPSEVHISENVDTLLNNETPLTENVTPSEALDSNTSSEAGVTPSCGCNKGKTSEEASTGCGCNKGKKQAAAMVYAIGTLGYEFKTSAKRDSFQQAMGGGNPNDTDQLLSYLDANPEAVEDVLWTLNLDATQIYVIYPVGGYSPLLYDRIKGFLRDQKDGKIQRISVPGMIGGTVNLMNGLSVPILVPKGQGMYSWSTEALISAVLGKKPTKKDEALLFSSKATGIQNFLDRVYYELRNLGTSSEERAINYAATNAFQLAKVFENAVHEELELSAIDVERSPICPPNSDCWDVKLTFFNPSKRTEQARKVFRFTVDVSHVIPVTVGEIRSWNVY